MIHYIKGYITDTLPGRVVIENGGIGYEVFVPDNSPAYLASESEMVTIYTSMVVKEDSISLCGFTDSASLEMFQLLTSVSGVGSKGAMSILSKLTAAELRQALVFEDADALTKANGIGKKTAQRIVLDLKDKVNAADLPAAGVPAETVKLKKGSAKEEAVLALQALGFSKTEAMSALVGVNDSDLTAEEYIKIALRRGK